MKGVRGMGGKTYPVTYPRNAPIFIIGAFLG
jgi:hypothetical protein